MVNKIFTIVADDEPLARKKLAFLLGKESDVLLLAECSCVEQTVSEVNTKKPHLLFLDIEMPDGNAFEALERIDPESMPVVIFTTAYDTHAVRAFEANVLDYLLKPFDEVRFRKSLDRAKLDLTNRKRSNTSSGLMNSMDILSSTLKQKLVFRAGGRMLFVNPSEIDWVEAASNYIRLHVGSSSYLVRTTIREVETRLDPEQFMRIHRSVIVNADRIKEMKACNSGEFMVTLSNGKVLPASRSYRENIDSLLQDII